MSPTTISDLLAVLNRLKDARIYYTLSDHTEGAIMVEISVPGERWEVEFHQDGRISVEVFVSTGVKGPDLLEDMFRRFGD